MILKDILKVLYAPHKVLKQILQNPRYLGALLVLVLFLAAQTGYQYTLFSKQSYEFTSPTSADVADLSENATLWTASPGASVSSNYTDFINGTFLADGRRYGK